MDGGWGEIAALFDSALERAPGQRRGWLRGVCDDEDQYRAVERLLEAHERSTGILDESPFNEPSTVPSLTDERLGSYRLLSEIGRGGMGTVYLADRDDEQFDHRVAVKVLRHEVSDDGARRFLAERQILATLDHPNIATLYDGGVTQDGLPYFVMEYVEGTPLHTYCDQQELSIEERLELFVIVARAVHAAHRNLVVHRDLKPSNVLVKDDGTVKLLDFGIAKLLDPAAAGLTTLPQTRTGAHPMTLAYASPEQVTGEQITTASDVYQLGLVLYEVLVGHRPYEVERRSPSDAEQIICEERPSPPSTAVAEDAAGTDDTSPPEANGHGASRPDVLRRTLRGDLDAIVMMTLRKEPERRYSSAQELAEDIDRYLDGRPVIAHPDTWRYRLRSFVRRHRTSVVATLIVLISLVGGVVGIAWQAYRASEQAEIARQERDKAQEVTTFLMDLFEASDPGQTLGDTVTARVLLDRGVERAQALDDEPRIQAQMFDVVGRVYQRLGRYEQADSLLTRALVVRRSLHPDPHPDVAESLHHLGNLQEDAGAYATAETLLTSASAQYEALYDESHPDVVSTQHALGTLFYSQGKYDRAEPLLRATLEQRQDRLGKSHPDVISSLNNLAVVLQRKGDYAAAETMYRRALDARQARLGAKHPKVATSIHNLGTVLEQQGKLDAAERYHRDALSMRRQLFEAPHPDIASSLQNVAALRYTQGRYAAAEQQYRNALKMRREVLGDTHPHTGITLNNLARLLEEQGHPRAAEDAYRETLSVFRTAFGSRHPYVAHPLVGLGRILMKRGAYTDAASPLREALAIRQTGLPTGHWKTALVHVYLGHALGEAGKYEAAEPHLTAGYQTLREKRGPDHEETLQSLEYLVDLYDAWEKPAKAERYQQLMADADSS